MTRSSLYTARCRGYTHNPRVPQGYWHMVTEFGEQPMGLACGLPAMAMEQIALSESPKGPLCPRCAEYVRIELLRWAVERFPAENDVREDDAAGFIRIFAARARAVLS